MTILPPETLTLLAAALGVIGVFMILQARMQSRLLKRRIAAGEGYNIVDPLTGLWSAEAAWQCIRAEANRSLRLGHPLDVWVGTTDNGEVIDTHGRAIIFELPAGAMGIRLNPNAICVVSCTGFGDLPNAVRGDLTWHSTSFEPGEQAASLTQNFVDTHSNKIPETLEVCDA